MAKAKRTLSMNFLLIGIFTLLAVGSWVTFDVYRAVVKTTVPRVLQSQIAPLDPDIDPAVLSKLRSRRQFSEQFLQSLTPRVLLEEESGTKTEEALVAISEASPSAQLATEPAATESGELETQNP